MSDDFFGPPPPPPEPDPEEEEERSQLWHVPENVLGATVALDLLLGSTDEIAVSIPSATVYPNGMSFALLVRGRRFDSIDEVDDDWPPSFRRRAGTRSPEERLRFGVQLSDGSKATNDRRFPDPLEGPPDAPLLSQHGGSGGGREFRHRFWLWPLPPPGRLAFVLEWRAAGIPLTRREIDAGPIRDAADRAVALWPETSDRSGFSRSETSEWFSMGIAKADDEEED